MTFIDPDGDAISLTLEDAPETDLFTDNGDGTGIFSWQTDYTDSVPEGYQVTFFAKDTTDGEARESVTILVSNVNQAPEFTPVSPINLTEKETKTITLSAIDKDNPPDAPQKGLTFEFVAAGSVPPLPKGTIQVAGDKLLINTQLGDAVSSPYTLKLKVSDLETLENLTTGAQSVSWDTTTQIATDDVTKYKVWRLHIGIPGCLGDDITMGLTMTHIQLSITFVSAVVEESCDISSVAPDLTPPTMVDDQPASGKRVKQVAPKYKDTEVYHALYLPTDWQPNKRYPVIVEYTGNGGYRNKYGDICTGKVEDSKLGYGISGGEGFIWICMPYLNNAGTENVAVWWGNSPQYNVGPTLDYCKKAVSYVCEIYGGDSDAVILTGFSRGAIACNYLGLYDDDIAKLWLAFIPFSHYDGVREGWPYPQSDKASARRRLNRLNGRAQFICSESHTMSDVSLAATERYLKPTCIEVPFTFMPTGFRNHNDAWVLRPSPARTAMRQWLTQVLKSSPSS